MVGTQEKVGIDEERKEEKIAGWKLGYKDKRKRGVDFWRWKRVKVLWYTFIGVVGKEKRMRWENIESSSFMQL